VSNRRQRLGKLGEEMAAAYLQAKGYGLLVRNYRCRSGEIDIIAQDKNILVFIEVRCRSSDRFGYPQESILRGKQTKLRRAALEYLQSTPGKPKPVRFDVLALMYGEDSSLKHIEHIENAF